MTEIHVHYSPRFREGDLDEVLSDATAATLLHDLKLSLHSILVESNQLARLARDTALHEQHRDRSSAIATDLQRLLVATRYRDDVSHAYAQFYSDMAAAGHAGFGETAEEAVA